MFKHIFENRLRCILRNRVDLFWSSLFPLLLATLFYVALGNLNTATRGDVDPEEGDGVVSLADAAVLLRRLAGL